MPSSPTLCPLNIIEPRPDGSLKFYCHRHPEHWAAFAPGVAVTAMPHHLTLVEDHVEPEKMENP